MNNLIIDDFFDFDLDLDVVKEVNFKSKFKIIENNGYKLQFNLIYKRSLSKDDYKYINDNILNHFPLSINVISGINIENFKINKLYEGQFQINILNDKSFDLYFLNIIEN